MKQIGQGRTADIFEIGEDKIIKLYKKDFPIEAIKEEYEVSQFVHSSVIPTPEPFELVEKEGRQGIIFQKISGKPLLGMMTRNPLRLAKLARNMADLHGQLHAEQAGELNRDQRTILTHNIRTAPYLTAEEKVAIVEYLNRLPEDNRLCHGDFHPDNILVGDKNWVIDWMTGMRGNPAGDVARTYILLTYGTVPDGIPNIVKTIINGLRNRIKNIYLNHYLKHTSQEFQEIDSWILPVAAARLTDWVPQEEKDALLKEIRTRLKTIS